MSDQPVEIIPVDAAAVVNAPASQEAAFNDALALLTGEAKSEPAAEAPVAPQKAAPKQQPLDETPAKSEEAAQKPDPFKSKFEQLQKEWSKLDAERNEFKTLRKELSELKAARDQAKISPSKMLEFFGLSQEQFTQQLIKTGGELSDEAKLALEAKQEVEKLRAEREAEQKQAQEHQKQQALDKWRSDVAQFLQKSEEHELANNIGAVDAVMNVIHKHYADTYDPTTGTGEVLSLKQAADVVEQHLEQDLFEKLLKTNKLQKRLGTTPRTKSETPRPSQTSASKTLTGTMSPQTQASKPLTDADRFDAALRMLTK